jgi:hypothetical protein
MTPQQKHKNNQVFTSILVIQEVSQRLLSELIDTNLITHDVKQSFHQYLKFGEKFRNKWIKAIRLNYGDEAEELHERDADELYDLFNIIKQLSTDEQFIRAKALLNNLVNDKRLSQKID